MSAPTVTLVDSWECRPDLGRRVYRLEGGTVAPGWAREGRAPWCEITIWMPNPGGYLGAFGGEVWPMAWPELFECGRGTAQSGPWTRLTRAGWALIQEADMAAELEAAR